MKRKFRLTKSSDFQRVRQHGKSYAHPLLVLFLLPSEGSEVHIGVAAGRGIGNAVQRNRAKRLIRAALQPFLEQISPGWYGILIARKPIQAATFAEIQLATETLLVRAKIFVTANND